MTTSSSPEILHVDLAERGYDIVIGPGLLARTAEWLTPVLAQPRAIIISDDAVAPLHLPALAAGLESAGIRQEAVVLPAGEGSKSFRALESLLGELLNRQAERRTTLIALGGGVIGDLTGFAASILRRGVPFVQIPTTLLAQVDSSVGGKTGINTPHGKNLVGSFCQPRLVLADTGLLDTLPARQLRAGYAEVVKYGLINDPAFFAWLEAHGADVLTGNQEARIHTIRTSCAAKAAIVAEDEREGGVRALLNLGHTFGHALEAETGYSDTLLHGEGVAVGMAQAFTFSARLGLCPPEDAERVGAHLQAAGLPVRLSDISHPSWNAERLLAHMYQDKKVQDGALTFILTRGIGQAFIARDVAAEKVRAFLKAECKG